MEGDQARDQGQNLAIPLTVDFVVLHFSSDLFEASDLNTWVWLGYSERCQSLPLHELFKVQRGTQAISMEGLHELVRVCMSLGGSA